MVSPRKKIMLVDDDQTILQTGRYMLKSDYDVYPLPSAEKLFEALKRVVPDLILLDIQMPDESGFDVILKLKLDERYESIPVIFLTATNDRDSVILGVTLGASDFVIKPFSADDLILRIEKQLGPERKTKKTVMVIDDSPEILMSAYTMLRDAYKVYTLPEPEKLSSILQKVKPDLFLLDYKMPSLSGFDLIPIIRGFHGTKRAPIIFLTSEGTAGNLTAAIGQGACDFIVKPFDQEVLCEKIAKHIK
ncbi:MAG: response regulator [Defluviitaleaceae bacterium]|nr:response regulator [Defluviitaleaceae bacterium]